jgi:phage shock protein A
MGIFDRFSRVLRANINDLISSAEDPEKMLNQLIADMNGQLVKAKQQVAAAIADEKRLKDQADAEFRLAADWESRAVLAINEQRDDLAKQACCGRASTPSTRRRSRRRGSRTASRPRSSRPSCASSPTASRRRSARRTCSSPGSAAPRRRSASRRP